MRIQPQTVIQRLEADNSRLAKEAILADAVNENLTEFFDGVRMALDKLYTFGIKQVPVKEVDNGQGLPWLAFVQLAENLYRRTLTGHAARDAVQLAMDVATKEQWNDWYRRILIKDLRCGVSEKTVNKVLKKTGIAPVPVFECMLAHDGANHEGKIAGKKLYEPKLDGVRCLTVIDFESRTVVQYTRNGKVLENFGHITAYLETQIDNFGRSYVLDGEVVSKNFNTLMTQVHRKSDVQASDARLVVFDIVPLSEFKQGKSVMGQRRRSRFLRENFGKIIEDSGFMEVGQQREFDLDVFTDQIEAEEYFKELIAAGYEGVLIKDPEAKYVCKRDAAWLKQKPYIEVSLTIVGVEEGTGKNAGKMGALVCEGEDSGTFIKVNVGSGFSDDQRQEIWEVFQQNPEDILQQIVEVRADVVSQNQDGTYSLRFPRFRRFRGFKKGEKI